MAASALVEPSRDWLITGAGPAGGADGRGRGSACRTWRRCAAMTAALVDLDHRFGSGHVRPVLVHYLNSVVSGLLSGSYRESVGRELFGAVARLTELAGYMAVDTGQPGLAQRYYIQALRLAQAAGDRAYGGYVLAASMSHLAAQLGNPREIAQLARAAQEGARGQVTPRAEAMFHAAEARGHALMGDARTCQAAAGRALTALEQADPDEGRRPGLDQPLRRGLPRRRTGPLPPGPGAGRAGRPPGEGGPGGPPGVPRPAPRHRPGAAGHARRCSSARWSRRATRGRGRWNCWATVRSSRGAEYLDDLQQRFEPYADEPAVREFGARLELQAA